MRHLRKDYDAIQPWPTKRPHWAKAQMSSDQDPVLVQVAEPLGMASHVHPIIPDDEPVFLIRAKDAVGPATVRQWASFAMSAGANPDLVRRVFRWADEMEQYAQEHYGSGKTPDTPAGMLR